MLTPASLDEGLVDRREPARRPGGGPARHRPARARLARTDTPSADRRSTASARGARASRRDAAVDPRCAAGSVGGLAAAVGEATGIRLELARRSWVRLGRDVVGQRTEVLVARNRAGPPGRRATLRILYAEGGERDACLARDALLMDQAPARVRPAPVHEAPDREITMRRSTFSIAPAPPSGLREAPSPPHSGGRWSWAASPRSAGVVLDADPRRGRSASGAGCRWGRRTGWRRRRPSSTPSPRLIGPSSRPPSSASRQFSPAVAGTSDPADVAFGLLEAQVDGLEGLWGPEPALAERVGDALETALPGRPPAGRDRRHALRRDRGGPRRRAGGARLRAGGR